MSREQGARVQRTIEERVTDLEAGSWRQERADQRRDGQIERLTEAVGTLSQDVRGLQFDITEIKTILVGHSERLDRVEGRLEAVEGRLDRIEATQTEHGELLRGHGELLRQILAKLGG